MKPLNIGDTKPPVVSIVGRSESGKTTLIEMLIPELRRRGYRIGTIKHTHHALEIDQSGKDSSRHRAAGAQTVILASSGQIAMIKSTRSESVADLTKYFDDVDLLITEGYKREKTLKIEVLRAAVHTELLCRNDPGLIAVATGTDIAVDVPVFRLSDPQSIAAFIEQRFLLRQG
jgi:molybdopterin-guanine dinucleotide biosynthesis adapter protein